MKSRIRKVRKRFRNYTQMEAEALNMEYNFSDAHPHMRQSKSQAKITARLSRLWSQAEHLKQNEIEERFVKEFCALEKQYEILSKKKPLFAYSASISILIATNYLAKKNYSVTLIEPCFDNLADILKGFGMKPKPLAEELLHNPKHIYSNLKKRVTTDALFLVNPNNPTGFRLSEDGFREIARFCHDYKKLLIFDFSFLGFTLPHKELDFDNYWVLDDERTSYICIEDTGKIWPILDAKVSFIVTSDDVYEGIKEVQSNYLLNVSPFILNLVTQYVLDSQKTHFVPFVKLLNRNLSILKKGLRGTCLEIVHPTLATSVAWTKIKNPKLNASEVYEELAKKGIHVIPGIYFFWSNPQKGQRFVRFALARDTKLYGKGVTALRKALIERFGTYK